VTLDALFSIGQPDLAAFARVDLDEVSDDRVLLLELAVSLQSWPARNMVFKTALNQAARNLIRMAGQNEPA
jgi:hypothetical protein